MCLETAEVDIINLDDRVVHMTDGATIPIVDFFDGDGVDCEPEEAVSCYAGTDEYGWIDITIIAVEPVYLH